MSATEKSHPSSDGEWREIPYGWIKEYDYNSSAWYYVDSTRSPPRSIWVHPHDDPLFLKAHPQYRLSDEFPPEERRGLLGKLKGSTIGRSEKTKKEAERRAQENDFREWKERLSRQNAHAAKYGSPPQWKTAGTNSFQPNESSAEHTNGHDHGHDSHATGGTGSGTVSTAVHVGAVAGGEVTEAGDSDATHSADAGSGGGPGGSGGPGGPGEVNTSGSAQDGGGD